MNERTLELYKHAHVPHTAIDPSNNMPYETTCFSADKFADLIVRECLTVISKASKEASEQNTYMGDDVPSIVHQMHIAKHFGIK